MPLQTARSCWSTIFCSILLLASAARVQHDLILDDTQDDQSPGNTRVHLGPLSLSTEGVELKPQFKVGLDGGNIKAELGIGDVRDGLRLAAKLEGKVYAESEALTVQDLDDNIKCDTPGFKQALNVAKLVLQSGGEGITQIALALHVEKSWLEWMWHGAASDAAHPMKLRVKASLGIGASAQLSLGWEDTKHYHMVGAGGKASALISLGCSIFVGKHKDGKSLKVILGISNFGFEYTMPVNP